MQGVGERIGFVGFGRFGAALAELCSAAGAAYRAVDPVAHIPPSARADSLEALCAWARLLILSVPVPATAAVLQAAKGALTPGHLVMDVGSVKVEPVQDMARVLGREVPWIGTHPLFGPVSLSRAERPLRVVVCPNAVHPQAVATARQFFDALGCTVVEQSPEEHDRLMARTHALVFFLAKGLMDIGAEDVPFTPPSFGAIARTIELVRADAGHLFSVIERRNPFASAARRDLLDALSRVHAAIDHPEDQSSDDGGAMHIPQGAVASAELTQTRERIDELDAEILQRLTQRAELSRRAALAKSRVGAPVYDPVREAELLRRRREWADNAGLDAPSVEEIFKAILRLSKKLQGMAEHE